MRIFGSSRIALSILLCSSLRHHLGHLVSFSRDNKEILDRIGGSRLQRFFLGGRERERERVSSLPVNEAVRRGETDARQEDGIRDNFDERERLKLGNERSSGGQPV